MSQKQGDSVIKEDMVNSSFKKKSDYSFDESSSSDDKDKKL